MTVDISEQSMLHVEGQLAGWNDASMSTTTTVPMQYLHHPENSAIWTRSYRAGREAFMTAWEKGALGGTRFRLVSHDDSRHWRLPLKPKSEQPVAYLIDTAGDVLLTIAPAIQQSTTECYSIFFGELRVAVVTGNLLSAMHTAACYVR